MDVKKNTNRLLVIAAARLYSEGRLQQQIAADLAISQPRVSRLLQQAKDEMGLIDMRPTLVPGKVTEAEWTEVETRFFTDRPLIATIRTWIPKHHHFDLRVFEAEEHAFSAAAAGRLHNLLGRANLVGVLWGRTLSNLIAAIKLRFRSSEMLRGIECIPLCGDPAHVMNQDDQNSSASHLAAELERVLTGSTSRNLPSLTCVPAYLPRSLMLGSPQESSPVLSDFLFKIPGFQKIFRPSSGVALVAKVDTVVTGVGVFKEDGQEEDRESGAFLRERIAQEHLDSAKLAKIVYGDFGGILLPRPNLTPSQQSQVADLNIGWMGAQETDFCRIARQSRSSNRPGIIVVARGTQKAELIRHALQRGLVNELIIDIPLARKLQELSAISIAKAPDSHGLPK